MSRCFPYTPLANQRTGESLTAGSIKLQKESKHSKEKKQKREKRHKKHKDENRKETAVASSQKDHSSLETGEHLRKKRKYFSSTSSVLCGKNCSPNEADKCPVEQLEGSGLSEEHGLPCFIPAPCESSESTHNSSKSRKLEGVGTASKSHGSTILRFKLPKHKDSELFPSSALPPLRKHKDPELAPNSALPGAILMPSMKQKDTEQVTTSSALPGPKHKDTPQVPSNEVVCRENKVPEWAPINEEPCFSGRTSNASHQKETSEAGRRYPSSRGSKRKRRAEEMERQLRDLLVVLGPAPLLEGPEAGDSDQGWLLGSSWQQQKDPGARSCGMDSVVAEGFGRERAASSFQPVACFMQEFDSYQLPYVLPY